MLLAILIIPPALDTAPIQEGTGVSFPRRNGNSDLSIVQRASLSSTAPARSTTITPPYYSPSLLFVHPHYTPSTGHCPHPRGHRCDNTPPQWLLPWEGYSVVLLGHFHYTPSTGHCPHPRGHRCENSPPQWLLLWEGYSVVLLGYFHYSPSTGHCPRSRGDRCENSPRRNGGRNALVASTFILELAITLITNPTLMS